MNSRPFFKSIFNTLIVLNLVFGLGSIALIERLVPAIDKIMSENATSVSSAVAMMNSLNQRRSGVELEFLKTEFLTQLKSAQSNITIPEERPILAEIERIADSLFLEVQDEKVSGRASELLLELASLNLNSMAVKNAEAKRLGLAGGWAVGFLLMVTIFLLLIFKKRVEQTIVAPIENVSDTLQAFLLGNKMRRYTLTHEEPLDIKKLAIQSNKLMDEST